MDDGIPSSDSTEPNPAPRTAPGDGAADESSPQRPATIKLFGIGGAGMNAVSRLARESLGEIELAVVNTDSQALSTCSLDRKHLIGEEILRGLGAGGDPEIGLRVAEAAKPAFGQWTKGAEVVLLVAGMGGGTGGPVVSAAAEAASQNGALTLAFAVMPFSFEGPRRQKQAEASLVALRQACDAVIPLPNDLLLQEMGEDAPVVEVLRGSDDWIARAVRSIWTVLCLPGQMNLDLGNLRRVFGRRGGKTLYGFGSGSGDRPADVAFQDLLMCPLLHTPEFASRADHLMIHIGAGPDFPVDGLQQVVDRIAERFGRDGHIALGTALEERLAGRVEICVLGATEIDRPGGVRSEKRATAGSAAPRQQDRGRAATGAQSGKQEKSAAAPAKPRQREFGFEEGDKRGFFNRSETNEYEGEDLDVPTYLRRGIRISL